MFAFFPIFGVLFILGGIAMSVYSFNKANDYTRAERRYRKRRSEVIRSRRPKDRF